MTNSPDGNIGRRSARRQTDEREPTATEYNAIRSFFTEVIRALASSSGDSEKEPKRDSKLSLYRPEEIATAVSTEIDKCIVETEEERVIIYRTLKKIFQDIESQIDQISQDTESDPPLNTAGDLKSLFESIRDRFGHDLTLIEIEHSPLAPIKPMCEDLIIEIGRWIIWVEFDPNTDSVMASQAFTIRFRLKEEGKGVNESYDPDTPASDESTPSGEKVVQPGQIRAPGKPAGEV